MGKYKEHQKLPLEKISLTQKCTEHNKELELFCKKCSVAVCLMCPFGSHKGHDCILLIDYAKELKKELDVNNNEIHSRIQILDKLSSEIEQERKQIEEVSLTRCCFSFSFSIQ